MNKKDANYMNLEELNLIDLQPSQFYISEEKVKNIKEWFDPRNLSEFEPIPIKILYNKPVMTDGHTRAIVAIQYGLKSVPFVWDNDELDWNMYRKCIDECLMQNIKTPYDLLNRIIDKDDYERKWRCWCKSKQNE